MTEAKSTRGEQIAQAAFDQDDAPESVSELADAIDEALRNERERALVDAAKLECVFCAGVEGLNPLPVVIEGGSYVHRNQPPKGLAGIYCKAPRIRALASAIRNSEEKGKGE